MVLRFLGEATTDENGLAVLSDGYTGTGAGEIDVVAKTEIDDSTLQSETYGVIDALLKDEATSFDSTKWNNLGCTTSYSNDGTNLKPSTDYRYQLKYDLTDDLAVEFDLNVPSSVSANPICYVRGQQPPINSNDFPRNNWNRVKFECRVNSIKVYCNGTFLYEFTPQAVNQVFQFRVTNSELTFKNFCIYPI